MATHVVHRHLRRPRTHARLVIGIVLLLVITVAAGVLIGRSTKPSAAPVEGLAPEKAVSVIDGNLAAQNRGDLKALETYWAKNAVMEEPPKQTIWKGRQKILAMNMGAYHLGARMYRVSSVIQEGNMAAYVMWGTMEGDATPIGVRGLRWIDLVQFDQNYRILHLWSGFDVGAAPTG